MREGEIVGLAGLMGAGRTELLTALYGTGPRGRWSGRARSPGGGRLDTVAAARRAGLGFVTDDRRGSGLMLVQSVLATRSCPALRRRTPLGVRSRAAAEAAAVGRALGGLTSGRPGRPARRHLSGGNQQKVVFAKEC